MADIQQVCRLHELMEPDVLFAYNFEGKPLEALHGGPLRLIVRKNMLISAPNGYER